MTRGNDLEYYRRREEQARKLAHEATDPCSRNAHMKMEKRYHEIVETGEIPTTRLLYTSAQGQR